MKNRTEILIADCLYAQFVIMQLGVYAWNDIARNGIPQEIVEIRVQVRRELSGENLP